jgi:hypothetical protein
VIGTGALASLVERQREGLGPRGPTMVLGRRGRLLELGGRQRRLGRVHRGTGRLPE